MKNFEVLRSASNESGTSENLAKPASKCLLWLFASIIQAFCIHDNRAIILGIKTGKPLETLADKLLHYSLLLITF